MNPFHLSMPLADLVTQFPETSRLLKANRLDFCCHGEVAFDVACVHKGINPHTFQQELAAEIEARKGQALRPNLEDFSLSELITYIVDKHHAYLRKVLPYLTSLCHKVAKVHGQNEPNLIELNSVFTALTQDLEPHLEEEETKLFPMLLGEKDPSQVGEALDAMLWEHREVGQQLAEIRRLTDSYHAPIWACRSFSTLYAELDALEDDLLNHIHIENHILAKRVLPGLALGTS